MNRADDQADRVVALSADERLFALLSLRWEDADALDRVIARAEKWRAEKAAERVS